MDWSNYPNNKLFLAKGFPREIDVMVIQFIPVDGKVFFIYQIGPQISKRIDLLLK